MTDMRTTNSTQPPNFTSDISYWERSLDPLHVDAFPFITNTTNSKNHRSEGWMAIDWIENPVGFIPDGIPTSNTDFVVRVDGPYSKICAYRTDEKQ